MANKRTTWLAALVLGMGLGCGVQAKTLHWAYQGDVNSLDPMSLNETFTKGFQDAFYEALVAYNKDLELVPALAVRWENPEPTKWIFYLREGVKFHDGSPFAADDVVFSWKRSLTAGSDFKSFGGLASEVKKIDDYTVEVTTPQPNPILPRYWVHLYMMSKSWAEKNHATEAASVKGGASSYTNLHENGTGPFKVVERHPDVKTTLKRFDGYWNKDIPTNLTEIVFQPITQESTRVAALISGELDLAMPIPVQDWSRLEKEPDIQMLKTPEIRAIFIGMDQHRDELLFSDVKGKNPFKDKRVREAIIRTVDTNVINKKIMRSTAQPLGTLIAGSINGYDESFGQPYKTDFPRAKKLMADAGYPNGFSVQMDCPNDRYVNDEKICQAVASMLARIGIKIDLLAQTKSKYFAKVLPQGGNNTSMYLLGWAPATVDAEKTLIDLVACRNAATAAGQFNLGGYCNKDIDALIAKIGVETDQEKRNVAINTAFTLLRKDYGYLPLHQQPLSWGVKKDISVEQRADDVLDMRTVIMP
ncbi:ABC transporter substrate-binding protein [Allopusillimonas ginsengisoli]|nr:ABC transporter substrate-binding protein [Allopusillimonas ginsengisoli]